MRFLFIMPWLMTISFAAAEEESVPASTKWTALRDQTQVASDKITFEIERDRLLDAFTNTLAAGIFDHQLSAEQALPLIESIPVFVHGYPRLELMRALEKASLVVQAKREDEARAAAAAKPEATTPVKIKP